MKGKTAALAALLALGALPVLLPSAAAQVPHPLDLSREERSAIAALQAAAAGYDRGAQDGALAAARAAARGAGARHAISHYQLEIGRARGDAAMQSQAVDAMVEGGLATNAELPALLAHQAARAFSAGQTDRTDRLLARIIELQPNNPVALADYGQFKSRVASRGQYLVADRTQAAALFARAIAASEAAGRPAPQAWYLRALTTSYDSTRPPVGATQLAPQAVAFARGLVTRYPSRFNWRDALLAYRDLSAGDPTLDLDIRRLARASEAMLGERDYMESAEALNRANLVGEAKAVLDEGVAGGMLDAAKPAVAQLIATVNRRLAADRAGLARLRTQAQAGTGAAARAAGDAHYGYGQYAEAAELYRLALQKGGEDANLINARLGPALALAGRRPEAEAALRAVTGPRADLAGFWLAWLARRPA
jgi:tetratricopeptide (TPR) repeat protein